MANNEVNNVASMDAELNRKLSECASADKEKGINVKFKENPQRAVSYSYATLGLHIDFSKTHINDYLLGLYAQHASNVGFESKKQGLFSGQKINNSEERAVLHTLLRDPDNQGIATRDAANTIDAKKYADQFQQKHKQLQNTLASRTVAVKDIIHVGIGGSSLGTRLLLEALGSIDDTVNVHFIGNIDAHQLVEILQKCRPESTLVIAISKSFGTAETLQNVRTIGEWFTANGINNFLENTYAVTTKPEKAVKFGIPSGNVIQFAEWVGGRYSVWSAVSLSATLIFGMEKFNEFLQGAAEFDKYFYATPAVENVCFIAAAMDHYYTNYWASDSRAVFAYDYRLRSLVDYLQQLETESNGKDRQLNGTMVDQRSSAVVWGGVGTDVQHSVFQMLHQGTNVIPSEFILIARAEHKLDHHHQKLLANGLAQPAALLSGQTLAEVNQLDSENEMQEVTAKSKIFTGERPSTVIVLEKITPKLLGMLLAFYEHRTFCTGLLININSFDQMGVELGKRLASRVEPMLAKASSELTEGSTEKFDPSTLALIKRIKDLSNT